MKKYHSLLFVLFTFQVNAGIDVISSLDFGAIPDDGFSDHEQIQEAINYAIKNKKSLYIPSGEYVINSSLTTRLNTTHSNNPIKIFGEKRGLTILKTMKDISLIKVTHNTDLSNLSLVQGSPDRRGVGIEIEYASYYSNFTLLSISGFDKGVYGKWLIWDRFQDLIISDTNVGIELHSNGESPGYWNIEPYGWFNNVLTFNNILINNSNIGFKMAVMGASIENSTVQNGNIGVWIFGPNENNKTWNNSITNFYSEGIKTVFKLENMRYINIDGFFAQGGREDNRYESVIDAKNVSLIEVKGATGQDWWKKSVILHNTNLKGSITAIGGDGSLDTNSIHINNKKFFKVDQLTADKKWYPLDINYRLSAKKTYRISISGIRDGYAPVLEEYLAYFWGKNLHKVEQSSGSGVVKVKIQNNQFYVQLNYMGGLGISSSKVTIEEVH